MSVYLRTQFKIFMGLFSKSDNSFLGVDIGDSSLKMVELKKKGKKYTCLIMHFRKT